LCEIAGWLVVCLLHRVRIIIAIDHHSPVTRSISTTTRLPPTLAIPKVKVLQAIVAAAALIALIVFVSSPDQTPWQQQPQQHSIKPPAKPILSHNKVAHRDDVAAVPHTGAGKDLQQDVHAIHRDKQHAASIERVERLLHSLVSQHANLADTQREQFADLRERIAAETFDDDDGQPVPPPQQQQQQQQHGPSSGSHSFKMMPAHGIPSDFRRTLCTDVPFDQLPPIPDVPLFKIRYLLANEAVRCHSSAREHEMGRAR